MNSTVPSPSTATVAKKRLLVVEDHAVMRRGIVGLLDLEEDLEVCGQAADAGQARKLLGARAFDLAILDVSLGETSGIDLAEEIKFRWPDLPMLMLSMHDEDECAERALRAGARGYVMKQHTASRLVDAVRRVLAGELGVSEKLRQRLDRGLCELPSSVANQAAWEEPPQAAAR